MKENGGINEKKLTELTRYEFSILEKSGMLWVFYPEAPEFYDEIKRDETKQGGTNNE